MKVYNILKGENWCSLLDVENTEEDYIKDIISKYEIGNTIQAKYFNIIGFNNKNSLKNIYKNLNKLVSKSNLDQFKDKKIEMITQGNSGEHNKLEFDNTF